MVRWGAANGVLFDPKKTEVMNFSRSKLRTTPAVRHGDIEKHPEPALRWLGIWLDSRLSFRIHVETWTSDVNSVAVNKTISYSISYCLHGIFIPWSASYTGSRVIQCKGIQIS
jgi:hypothetical protein